MCFISTRTQLFSYKYNYKYKSLIVNMWPVLLWHFCNIWYKVCTAQSNECEGWHRGLDPGRYKLQVRRHSPSSEGVCRCEGAQETTVNCKLFFLGRHPPEFFCATASFVLQLLCVMKMKDRNKTKKKRDSQKSQRQAIPNALGQCVELTV